MMSSWVRCYWELPILKIPWNNRSVRIMTRSVLLLFAGIVSSRTVHNDFQLTLKSDSDWQNEGLMFSHIFGEHCSGSYSKFPRSWKQKTSFLKFKEFSSKKELILTELTNKPKLDWKRRRKVEGHTHWGDKFEKSRCMDEQKKSRKKFSGKRKEGQIEKRPVG